MHVQASMVSAERRVNAKSIDTKVLFMNPALRVKRWGSFAQTLRKSADR
jgi:hypothetical protein